MSIRGEFFERPRRLILARNWLASDLKRLEPSADQFRGKHDDQRTVPDGGGTDYHLFTVAQVEGGLDLSVILIRLGGKRKFVNLHARGARRSRSGCPQA